MSAPLVSVIIPVHNGAHFLRESIPSVLAQDYEPIEIIVADDGSTDDSANVAESFAGVRCLRLEKGGVSRARNLAVTESGGEWLAFLDADDIWIPSKISTQIALASANADAGFVLCYRRCLFEGEIPAGFRDRAEGESTLAFEPSGWLVKRSIFESVGPFDESRTLLEDTEWLSRAWGAGVSHVTAPETLLIRRIHSANSSHAIQDERGLLFGVLRESVDRKRLRRVDS